MVEGCPPRSHFVQGFATQNNCSEDGARPRAQCGKELGASRWARPWGLLPCGFPSKWAHCQDAARRAPPNRCPHPDMQPKQVEPGIIFENVRFQECNGRASPAQPDVPPKQVAPGIIFENMWL